MSLYTFATAHSIASRIKSGRINQDWAVVDVRDYDFIGGHIPGCHHIPSVNFRENCSTWLLEKIKDVKFVVFHCALSQQRGPQAAKLYAEMREEALIKASFKSRLPFGAEARCRMEAQEIVILQGGFKSWVEHFKDERALIENYNPQLW